MNKFNAELEIKSKQHVPEQSPYSPYGTNDLQRESAHPQCPYFLGPVESN